MDLVVILALLFGYVLGLVVQQPRIKALRGARDAAWKLADAACDRADKTIAESRAAMQRLDDMARDRSPSCGLRRPATRREELMAQMFLTIARQEDVPCDGTIWDCWSQTTNVGGWLLVCTEVKATNADGVVGEAVGDGWLCMMGVH